jgi:hypothetical protein
MLDAVAQSAELPAADVRRAATFAGGVAAVARAALEGGETAPRCEDEVPTRLMAMQDHLALGLRLCEGVDRAAFRVRFGDDLVSLLGDELDGLLRAGVLELTGGRLRIASRHLLVSNEVILRLHEALQRESAREVGFRRDERGSAGAAR